MKKRYILGTIFIVVITVLSILLAFSKISAAASANIYENTPVTNGYVYAIATDPTYVYIGGQFTRISTYTGSSVLLNTTSGSRNTSIPKTNGIVNTIVPDGSGGWYIGGSFTKVGTQSINYAAHINSSGILDTTWNPNPSSIVDAIAISGSNIYIGGLFSTIGGQTRNALAKVNNTDGTADATWNPNPNSVVESISISGSDIYVSGQFATIGGLTRNNVAKLNDTNGNADVTWNPNANAQVDAVVASGTDVYVIGAFTSVGGQTRNYVAKLNNTTGAADSLWNPNPNGTVLGISVVGSTVYLSGQFTNIGGLAKNRLAKINNANGLADGTWDPNSDGKVNNVLAVGTDIYVVGEFTNVGGQARKNGAKLNDTNGAADLTWNPTFDDYAVSIGSYGTDVYVGGAFVSIGPVVRNNIARFLKSDMTLDASWDPSSDNNVLTLAVSGSDIYAGGEFTTIGGKSRNAVAKLNNTTGAADNTWDPRTVLGALVNSVAISGSDIYVGGQFTSIGGFSRSNIAKLNNTNADADPIWNPNSNNAVYTINISGTDIFVGGMFNIIGGAARSYLAKLNNTNGNADGTWSPNPNGYVTSMAISGSDLYIGGTFTSVLSTGRNYLAKLNTSTNTLDSSWNPLASSTISSVSISGTDIYVGGNFTSVGGQTRNRIAKLDTITGSADLSWNPNANSTVNEIYASNSDVYVGGNFSTISSQNRMGFAYYPPTSTDATVTSGTYTVSAGGTSSETITNVPFATAKATFLAALSKGNVYQSWNSSTITDPVTSNNTLVVTAEDGVTTVTYTITVNPDPDINDVARDKVALTEREIKGGNVTLSSVTTSLTNPLPSSGSNGSSITWASSNPSIVSDNGQVVTRPPFGQMDASVNMTATLTKGAASDTKVFALNVLASPSNAKAITTFNFSSPSVLGQINETNHTISLLVPYDTDLSAIPSVISTTGSAVSPASGETHSYVSPYIYLVYAADSTTQEYTVTVTKVAANQTVPDVNGNATINNTTNQLVVTDPNQVVNLTVTDGTSNPTINYGNLTTIPETIVTSSTATINIPPSTTVTSGTPWDGVMNGPHDTVVTLPQISGYTGTLNYATELGFTLDKLTFDKGVRIIFKNGAGKRVGYSLSTEPLTEITTLCSEDSQAVGDALPAASDCKIDVGNDLILWTKHFTRFALFTETQNSSGSSNSGSGGGGGSPSAPTCDNPSPATPNITSIKYVKRGIISINWGAADKASSWTVAFGLKSGNYIYGLSDFGDNGSRSVNVSSLTPRTYYLSLRANNGCRPGDFSPEWQVNVGLFGITARLTPTSILNKRAVSTSINTPQITQIKYVAPGVINISWNQINGANSWTISYGLRSKKYIYGLADFGDSNSRSVNIGGLRNGTYYFVIRSNSNQPGNFSSEWRVTIYKGGVNASQVK